MKEEKLPAAIEVQMKLKKKRNYHQIRELIRISYGLGVNLTTPSTFKDSLRIVNFILTATSIVGMLGHIFYILRYIDDIPRIAESISTAFQTIVSIAKLIYFFFVQRKFYHLLYKAKTHEILYRSEIFLGDFAIKPQLEKEAGIIMNGIWRDVRRQLMYYICACTAIISNYFFYALFMNMYHKDTPGYQPIYAFPTLYPMWEGKGLSFPYYHIQMFICGCEDYIAGMCAVSFDGVFIVLSLHSVGLIEVLKKMIEHCTSPLIPPARRLEYLRYCIFQYNRTESYVREVTDIYRYISLSQFLLSLVILGITMFRMSIGFESDTITAVRMLMYISAAGYEVVVFCYNGQRVTTASEDIALAFYSCEWYNESEEFKQLLRMMIMRTNRIFIFDVSRFTTMSLPTLQAMVKTSGSYFLLLRNLAE